MAHPHDLSPAREGKNSPFTPDRDDLFPEGLFAGVRPEHQGILREVLLSDKIEEKVIDFAELGDSNG